MPIFKGKNLQHPRQRLKLVLLLPINGYTGRKRNERGLRSVQRRRCHAAVRYLQASSSVLIESLTEHSVCSRNSMRPMLPKQRHKAAAHDNLQDDIQLKLPVQEIVVHGESQASEAFAPFRGCHTTVCMYMHGNQTIFAFSSVVVVRVHINVW